VAPPDAGAGAGASAGAVQPTGAIYDLGYQGYDGPRLGRRAAIATLFWSSWRAAFGLGRSGRSKIVPWGLTVLALLPAVVSAGITAVTGQGVFSYDDYLPQIAITLSLFVAAQAPELVGGDQRHHVLSLYFSHAIQRVDYAVAKLGALIAALLVLTVVPQLILFFGTVLGATDVVTALRDEAPKIVQIAVSSLLYSAALAVIGLAIAAFTPRRSFATGGIIAFFLVTGIVGRIVSEMDNGQISRYAPLLDIDQVLIGVNEALFGGTANGGGFGNRQEVALPSDLPSLAFFAVLAGVLVIGTAIIIIRYRRVQA
jgi:ABC-2 type transport system permease protein